MKASDFSQISRLFPNHPFPLKQTTNQSAEKKVKLTRTLGMAKASNNSEHLTFGLVAPKTQPKFY